MQPDRVQNLGKHGLELMLKSTANRTRKHMMHHLNLLRRPIGGLLKPLSAGWASGPTMCCERKRMRLAGRIRALGGAPRIIRLEGGGGVKGGVHYVKW